MVKHVTFNHYYVSKNLIALKKNVYITINNRHNPDFINVNFLINFLIDF